MEYLKQKAEEKASLIHDRKSQLEEKQLEREDHIAQLKHELRLDEVKMIHLKEDMASSQHEFDSLTLGIKELFKQCRCDDWSLKLLLGWIPPMDIYSICIYIFLSQLLM